MKYIAVGDIHLEENLPYSEVPGQRMFDEIVGTWIKVMKYALTQQIKNVIIAGDLFNNISIAPAEMKAFKRMMDTAAGAGIKHIYTISGNHELDGEGNSIIDVFSGFPHARNWPFIKGTNGGMIARWSNTRHDNHELHLVSFCENNKNFKQNLETLIARKQFGFKYILVAHQPVKGRKLKAIRSAKGLPEKWFKSKGIIGSNYHICVFGDFHRWQPLPYKRGFYTGSLIQQDFRDEGTTPCFTVIDTKGFTTEKVELDVPTFHTITISEDPPGSPKLTTTTEPKKNSYIKFNLVGSKKFVEEVKNSKLMERLTEDLSKKLEPRKIFVTSPQITDRIIITPTVRRSMNDEELVQHAIKGNALTISDKELFNMGINFIKKARRKQRRS